MLLPHGAIVSVVDGQKFQLFRNSGNEAAPELSEITAPDLGNQGTDAGMRHKASAQNPDGHQLDEDAHAAAVAKWLNQQVLEKKIEHLIVIAAPRTLGELRRHYNKQLEAVLISELSKDFAGHTGLEIIEALQAK